MCVINGVHTEYKAEDKSLLTQELPNIYKEFIFEEPVSSRGTSFCIWINEYNDWQQNKNIDTKRAEDDLLYIFDNKPETYKTWQKNISKIAAMKEEFLQKQSNKYIKETL